MKRFLIFCLLAIGIGFAQNPWVPSSPEITEPPIGGLSAALPASAEPAVQASVFNSVRGHGYNPFSIVGAASSVNDLVITPSDIYGKKFFYVSPSDKLGGAAFDLFSGSALLGLSDNNSLILGYATPAFGVAFDVSIRKMWTEEIKEVPTITEIATVTTTTRATFPGDNIGLSFSLPLGSATAYANGNWSTYDMSRITEISGSPEPDGKGNGWTKEDYSDINASIGLLGNFGSLNYDVYLSAFRHGGTLTSSFGEFSDTGDKVVTKDSYLEADLSINLGYVAAQNETARAIIGFNNVFGAKFLDEIDPDDKTTAAGSVMVLVISPNILGEIVVVDNLLAFAGAKHDVVFVFGPIDDDGNPRSSARNKDYSETIITQPGTEAFAGIRYQKTSWALEAQIFTNPFEALAGGNIFANFGGFIYF
jgi:hypothetical protein